MAQSASFANLRAILSAAQSQGNGQRIFIGSRDGAIVVCVNYNYESPPPSSGTGRASGKKRARDPVLEAVEQAVLRVKKGLKDDDDTVTEDMLASAQQALYTLLSRLRGAGGEDVVESWGLSFKKLEGPSSSQRPRLILSARLTPGVAVPLAPLFSCLGIRCTSDGLVTTQDSSSLASGFDLPLSEQAHAAELHGQRAVTLFATVAAS